MGSAGIPTAAYISVQITVLIKNSRTRPAGTFYSRFLPEFIDYGQKCFLERFYFYSSDKVAIVLRDLCSYSYALNASGRNDRVPGGWSVNSHRCPGNNGNELEARTEETLLGDCGALSAVLSAKPNWRK